MFCVLTRFGLKYGIDVTLLARNEVGALLLRLGQNIWVMKEIQLTTYSFSAGKSQGSRQSFSLLSFNCIFGSRVFSEWNANKNSISS